jgi:predicted DNA binding CopG/RHH family protein
MTKQASKTVVATPASGKTLATIPRFADEASERAFWESQDSSAYVDWSKARKVTFANLKPTTKAISLRLPQHLLDAIKSAANARDVPYQSLIKVWLQEKVQNR